jgi:hypothetical protein
MTIDLKSTKTLGLTMPLPLLDRADEVIEYGLIAATQNVCFWHKADSKNSLNQCPLSGVKRTCPSRAALKPLSDSL